VEPILEMAVAMAATRLGILMAAVVVPVVMLGLAVEAGTLTIM
jgi:hypothetical protein